MEGVMPKRAMAGCKKWGNMGQHYFLMLLCLELFASDIHTAIKINAAIPEEVRLHGHCSPSLIQIKDRTSVQSQQKYQILKYSWQTLCDIFLTFYLDCCNKSVRPSNRAYGLWWLSTNHPLWIHLFIHTYYTSIYIPCFWTRGLVLYQRGSDRTKELNINRLWLQLFLPFVPVTWVPKDAQNYPGIPLWDA